MSKVIMSNGGFYGCLSEPQGVSAWWKEIVQARVFVLSPSLLLNHFKPQSSKRVFVLSPSLLLNHFKPQSSKA